MGSPQNYGIELPERCLKLLSELWTHAGCIFPDHDRHLGPLTSTFLLSMSFPIVSFPIERIERPHGARGGVYIGDGAIDARASAEIVRRLRKQRLRECPFYVAGKWRFVSRDWHKINLSDGLPEDIASELSDDAAVNRAADMSALQWSSVLRNALSHGGVLYLTEAGRSSLGDPVAKYLFASGKYDRKGNMSKLTKLNFLRIDQSDYFEFLRLWVEWLSSCRDAARE